MKKIWLSLLIVLVVVMYIFNEDFGKSEPPTAAIESQIPSNTSQIEDDFEIDDHKDSNGISPAKPPSKNLAGERQANDKGSINLASRIENLDLTGNILQFTLLEYVQFISSHQEGLEVLDVLETKGYEALPAIGSLLDKIAIFYPEKAMESVDRMFDRLDETEDHEYAHRALAGLMNVSFTNISERVAKKIANQSFSDKRAWMFGLLMTDKNSPEQDRKYRKMAQDDPDPRIQHLGKNWEKYRIK